MALVLTPLTRGRLTARPAESAADREAALSLRRLCFRTARGLDPAGEGDAFDPISTHLLIEDGARALATCRLRLLTRADLSTSYTGQFYDLAALGPLPALELGRFCLAPGADPDALRLTFAALTRLVDATGRAFFSAAPVLRAPILPPICPPLRPMPTGCAMMRRHAARPRPCARPQARHCPCRRFCAIIWRWAPRFLTMP